MGGRDEQFVAESSVKPACTDDPCIGVNLRHVESGYHAKQIGNISRTRTRNVRRCDYKYCGGCPRYFLLCLGYGGHFGIHQVFEAQAGQTWGRCLRPSRNEQEEEHR